MGAGVGVVSTMDCGRRFHTLALSDFKPLVSGQSDGARKSEWLGGRRQLFEVTGERRGKRVHEEKQLDFEL